METPLPTSLLCHFSHLAPGRGEGDHLHTADARLLKRDAEIVLAAHLHTEHVEVGLGGVDRGRFLPVAEGDPDP